MVDMRRGPVQMILIKQLQFRGGGWGGGWGVGGLKRHRLRFSPNPRILPVGAGTVGSHVVERSVHCLLAFHSFTDGGIDRQGRVFRSSKETATVHIVTMLADVNKEECPPKDTTRGHSEMVKRHGRRIIKTTSRGSLFLNGITIELHIGTSQF